MLGNLLSRFQTASLARPRVVLAVCAVLVLVAIWLAAGVELRTSRNELAPAGDPDQRRWEALLRDTRATETVIACVEAAPGEEKSAAELEGFTDLLARAFASDPLVGQVYHRFDVDWVLQHGLYLLPDNVRRSIDDAFATEGDLLAELAATASLSEVNRSIARRMRRGFTGAAPPPDAGAAVSWLARYLEAQRLFLENTGPSVERWTRNSALLALAGDRAGRLSNGYTKSHDGRTLFVLITPASADDSLPVRRALLTRLRGHVDSVAAARGGFKVAFTGQPAMTVEEMDTVRRDTLRTSAVAIVGVSLLTLLVFRWKTHALLVLLALGVGVVWALGAVRLELGYLNLITSAFISTLVGVGVAYGIHPVSEYELEGAHTEDSLAAVLESYRRTAPAVAVAGLTTSAAFLSILLMRFRGFAELGLVAGVGVLLCLVSALVCLPAILVVYGRRRGERDRAQRDRALHLDRLWLERIAERVCRFPRIVTATGIVATLLLGWAATGLTFNANILDLLPREAESLRYQRRVTLESDLSPVFNFVVAEDLAELETMQSRAAEEPAIERFESALRFLPTQPEATRAMLASWNEWLGGLRLPDAPTPIRPAELIASLRDLDEVLQDAANAAFTAGMGQLAGPLEQASAAAQDCIRVAERASPEAVAAWNNGQRSLFVWLGDAVAFLQEATRVEPPSPGTLPRELRERFFTSSGKPLGFLFPSGSVFDRDELDRYVRASLRVSEGAIGFPFMFDKMSRRITTGFYRAVLVGAVWVLVILLIDFRDVRHALLAASPLAIGVVWTLGAMRLVGLSFNFANLVAVPLIVGVGIDNGVHVMHRVRLEGQQGMRAVLRHTGRAILISSLTTMIGFGSLALASHRGLRSLGLLLLLGVGFCLIASIILLPNLLVVLGQAPPRRPAPN